MKKTSLLFAALIALAGMAQAATVSYSDTALAGTITPNGVSTAISVVQFNNTIAGPNGDQLGATLTGVTLTITGEMHGTADCINDNAGQETWRVTLGTGLQAQNILFGTGSTIATINPSYNHLLQINPGTTQISPSSDLPNPVSTVGYSSNLGAFQGTGNVAGMQVFWAGSWGNSLLQAGDTFTPTSLAGSVTWTVEYTYSPVPEPTGMALLALGCAAVGLRRRVRCTKKA